MSTFGPAYDEHLDGKRIASQLERVRDYCLARGWLTVAEIAEATGDPEPSVSAQLRHLRKKQFGGYDVPKRRTRRGPWEYRVNPPKGQGEF